jgi:hypothetical protein
VYLITTETDEDKRNGWAHQGMSCFFVLSATQTCTPQMLTIDLHILYSGMPLLDLLKELNVAAELPRRTFSSAEDWISMSTASGLGGYPFLLDSNAQSSLQGSTAEEQTQLSESEVLQPDLAPNDLWPRVTAIAPQLLLDK